MEETSDSAELWNLTLQHSPIGMALVAPDGHLLRANPAMAAMLGYTVGELQARGFQEITHADDLAADLALLGRTLAGEISSYRLRKRYLHAQGRVIWGDLSVALVRSPDGQPLHFISQILDVTEHQDHAERLRSVNAEVERERQALEAIFEAVGVGLLLVGRDGRYERTNLRHQQAMEVAFPDGHDGAAGQLGHVFHLDGRPISREEMPSYRAVQGEEFDDYTFWAGADPLNRSAFSTSARQVLSATGEKLGAALAYQDVTDLLRALQVKDDFVSSVSHELRTPLTSVLGHLEMLEERLDLPPEVTAQLRVTHRNATRLLTLVTDLLHVGQRSAGPLLLHRTDVDLAALVREVVEATGPSASAAGVDVEAVAPGRLVVPLDEQRIRQVLDNLVGNAVKYTEPGGSVSVRLRQAAGAGATELEVHDTGIGIAPDELDHVFERFARGGAALDRHIPGTGLGLDIVRQIVAAHGAQVCVRSELGRGSVFTVTFP
ncbi:sensor histidine kinase [Nocardioides psychrotolerans]|uniref:histidine kinase n=1 Tax=Nocardioides psychrotolerans TaxID=1005945 RepID=A0A1I3E8I9_9ACTN|nr:ATP-binding protein [Nocardioides psychrotolerans]SFH95266.1 hypothetical protein SAMN05216561_103258 [Nocardioides psychrotolerans]